MERFFVSDSHEVMTTLILLLLFLFGWNWHYTCLVSLHVFLSATTLIYRFHFPIFSLQTPKVSFQIFSVSDVSCVWVLNL